MKRTTVFTLSLTLALALMTTVVLAWGPGFGRGVAMGPGYGYPSIPTLTAEQSFKIQALQRAPLDEIAPLQQDFLKKKTEIRNLWLSPTPDQAKITTFQKEILNLQAKITEKATSLGLEIQEVLTPEQGALLSVYGPGMGRGMKMGRMGRW